MYQFVLYQKCSGQIISYFLSLLSLSLWSYWKIWTSTWILSCRDSSVSWYSLQSASMERRALDHSVCLRNNSSRSSCALFSSSRRWASRSVFSGRLPEISRLFSCSTLQNEQIRRWRCHATNCEQPPKWETSCLSLFWPSFQELFLKTDCKINLSLVIQQNVYWSKYTHTHICIILHVLYTNTHIDTQNETTFILSFGMCPCLNLKRCLMLISTIIFHSQLPSISWSIDKASPFQI